MKKALVVLALIIGISPALHAVEVAVATVIVYAADQSHKWAEKQNRKKGYSKEPYPLPGYGQNDRYYTHEDIVDHFKQYNNEYSFITTSPPGEAIALLPRDPGAGNIGIASTASSPAIKFEWEREYPKLRKGDIVFSRSSSQAARAIQFVSSWVHTAVLAEVNRDSPRSIESYLDKGGPDNQGGVGEFNPKKDWAQGYSWSVKRIKPSALSQFQIEQAVDYAVNQYAFRVGYFPKYFSTTRFRQYFLEEWADKYNTSSMYCSKLTWRIFYNRGLDLDSERTSATVQANFRKNWTDFGMENPTAWIGVSGDDIYYSKYLSTDILTYGLENLSNPIPGLIL